MILSVEWVYCRGRAKRVLVNKLGDTNLVVETRDNDMAAELYMDAEPKQSKTTKTVWRREIPKMSGLRPEWITGF